MKNVHEIEIKVEGKEWEDAITKSFNKNVQNVKVDGFRKGKVQEIFLRRNLVKKVYIMMQLILYYKKNMQQLLKIVS